jgi:hypothetical protein
VRLNTVSRKYAGVIEVYDDAIPNTQEVLRFLKNRHTWNPALISGGHHDESKRDNRVTFFDPLAFTCPPLLRDFASVVWHYINDYAVRHDVAFSGMESVNINHYLPGERYKPHADAGPINPRVISALVYLNDVAEGGETEFIYHEVSVSPKAGRLIIFPSNYAYAHAAHPPVSGDKYSAAFWTVA